MEEVMAFSAEDARPIRKVFDLTLDLKRQSNIELKGLVSGDNGNVFSIRLTNGGVPVDDVDIDQCRVIMYIRSGLGWRSQDSDRSDGDITITDGVISIALHAASYFVGENLVQLEVYTTVGQQWDTLVTTQYFSFNAAKGATDSLETTDAYPALMQAIADANAAAADCYDMQIDTVKINDAGELIITKKNGNVVNAGKILSIGTESNHLVMTGENGEMYAGYRLYLTNSAPDPLAYADSDIVLQAVGDYTDLVATAQDLPAGVSATASFDEEHGVFTFGIPAGRNGKDATQAIEVTGETEEVDIYTKDEVDALVADAGKVQDVRINGASVVTDGVADIPLSSNNEFGVVKGNPNFGITTANGALSINQIPNWLIDDRANNSYASYRPITGGSLDYAVKAALTDGKGPAYTEAEKASARERIGAVGGEYELIEEITLTEDTDRIDRNIEPNGTQYKFHKLRVYFDDVGHTRTKTINAQVGYIKDGLYYGLYVPCSYNGRMYHYGCVELELIGGYLRAISTHSSSLDGAGSAGAGQIGIPFRAKIAYIDNLRIIRDSVDKIPEGVVIKIYGVRA